MRGIIKFIPPLIVVGLVLSGNLLAHPSAKPILSWSKDSQQSIKFERLSLEQGLSQSVIRCIFQDSKGFMWFGTHDGLNRYDGYRFTVYKHDPENPNSLSANSVYSIGEDKSGGLWIGTDDGLNKFDRETETFTQYKNDPGNPNSLSHNNINIIFADKAGVLWLGSWWGGLNKLVPSTSSGQALSEAEGSRSGSDTQGSFPIFIHYKNEPNNPHSLSSNEVSSIYEDRAGALWIGTTRGLNKFDRETETFTRYQREPNNLYSLSYNGVAAICDDPSGNLWVATGWSLNKLVPTKSGRDNQGYSPTFLHYRASSNDPKSLNDDVIESICMDHSGMLWIGTEADGLNRFNPQKEEFTHYKNEPENPNSLSDNRIQSLYEDRTGVLWIGTFGGGINKLDLKHKKFSQPPSEYASQRN